MDSGIPSWIARNAVILSTVLSVILGFALAVYGLKMRASIAIERHRQATAPDAQPAAPAKPRVRGPSLQSREQIRTRGEAIRHGAHIAARRQQPAAHQPTGTTADPGSLEDDEPTEMVRPPGSPFGPEAHRSIKSTIAGLYIYAGVIMVILSVALFVMYSFR